MLKLPPVTTDNDLDAFFAEIFSNRVSFVGILCLKKHCKPLLRTADIFLIL